MNSCKAVTSTIVVTVLLAMPVLFAIGAVRSLSVNGQLDDAGSVATLTTLWLMVAILFALLGVAHLTGSALFDVRRRGLGNPASVSPQRLAALTVAERSHYAGGAGPDPVLDRSILVDLHSWIVPVRTPAFADTDRALLRPASNLEPVATTPMSLAMPSTEDEVAAYEGPTDEVVAARGDTWWTIAADTLGSGERWREVAELNLGRHQDDGVIVDSATRIRRGYQLTVPRKPETEEGT